MSCTVNSDRDDYTSRFIIRVIFNVDLSNQKQMGWNLIRIKITALLNYSGSFRSIFLEKVKSGPLPSFLGVSRLVHSSGLFGKDKNIFALIFSA